MFASSGGVKSVWILVVWGGIVGCGGGASKTTSTVAPPPPPPPVSGTCTPTPASSLTVSVMDSPYNAKADGVTDDGPAIQKAVDYVAGKGGGTVAIPAGTYAMDPVRNNNAAIRLGNHVTLNLDARAVLQAVSTSTSNYRMLMVSGSHDVNIHGGMLVGNRNNNNIGDANEGGTGIEVVNSQRVVVDGVTARDFWGDGFYVSAGSTDVLLCGVVADNNRRSGMSVVRVDGMVVRDSTFKNTTGMMENGVWVCGAGVDIEPNLGETVNNVQFLGCVFASNAAQGLAAGPPVAITGQAFVTNVVIDGNTATGNGTYRGASGIEISNTSGHQIKNNTVTDNIGDGIYLRDQASNILVSGNTVTGTQAAPPGGDAGNGILLYKTAGNTIQDNTVKNNAACGIRDASPSGTNTIGSNSFSSNRSDVCR